MLNPSTNIQTSKEQRTRRAQIMAKLTAEMHQLNHQGKSPSSPKQTIKRTNNSILRKRGA